ncbi:MAG: B12-binding domain-containing radical SAM protein [Candidatus Saccharibacteria bacterium]
MRYEGTVYRPPSEANSLLIQATIGCPHNKCTFCPMYKGTRFRLRPATEILEDLKMAYDHYGNIVKSLFFPDGNTIIMKTSDLVQIFEYAKSLFTDLNRITVYGSARYASKKSLDEFMLLHEKGLTRIHMGMESGDDVTLAKIQKGATAEQIIDAGCKIRQAGIELSEYYLVGAGGQERTREHALESARLLSQIKPEFVRLRTVVPVPGTPLYQEFRSGDFHLLSPHQALQEIRLLVEHMDAEGTTVLSDHVSNYWNIQGILNQDREKMLAQVDQALTVPEDRFRPAHLSAL